ncbi:MULTISPECIES: MvaI/BcnI family restriction endonuclease [unclassified Rhodanobacter]|uniref:MvaI/BcnI family restriction endonuclease n=1 Tax=Rhodanobacter humi TaxID=1888173 RepID=A0ABV4ARJ3_9GAMM
MTASLTAYAEELATACKIQSRPTEVFAKILTSNDDSGRHGVLIPNEMYSFFPELPVPDPRENSTILFHSMGAAERTLMTLGWKYYQRYPERRITRLNSSLNDIQHGRRLLIFVRLSDHQGNQNYITDTCVEGVDPRFYSLLELIFGPKVPAAEGAFVRLPISGPRFSIDNNLEELLGHFDRINAMGPVNSLRSGDTGIGYTFETLIGIEENNDKRADFKGIEIKCKLKRNSGSSGKVNLFQQAPTWMEKMDARARLRLIGQERPDGLFACYSQVTPHPNNLGLRLKVNPSPGNLFLCKDDLGIGYWTRDTLAERLAEKHSRAIFVKAKPSCTANTVRYHYQDVVYCERPDIGRFIDLVESNKLVFEFTMRENSSGRVRNHGYPWRLNDESFLDQLYAVQVQLRGGAS